MDFKNKVVLITGASSGIGKQTAIEFAKLGSNIILVARRKDKLEQVENELKQFNVTTLVCSCDVSKKDQVEIMSKNVLEELASQWNENVNISYSKDRSEQHEANLLNLDITKTTSMLNWHPLLSIKNTIALTCEWYRNFYSNKSEMQLYTLEQIKKYESLLK